MQIIVLANGALKAELLSGSEPAGGVRWIANLQELAAYPPADAVIDLLFTPDKERMQALQQLQPTLIMINSVEKIEGRGTASWVRFNGWPTLLQGALIEAYAPEEQHSNAEKIFALFGKEVEWLPDEDGFASARVISMIINEAYRALEEGVSTESDINTAMKLGTNYPHGPFEWAQQIGLPAIHSLLQKMSKEEPRYQPAKGIVLGSR